MDDQKSQNDESPRFTPDLSEREERVAEERSAIGARVVHEAIRLEGEDELRRPSAALAWSGLAAGLSMGFSLVGEGLLRAGLPAEPRRTLVSKLGYSLGFLFVVLGRQQLFTENTLTAVIPFLARRDRATFLNVVRLWVVVLIANSVGALAFAAVVGNAPVFRPEVQRAFSEIGRESLQPAFAELFLRGIFAGWLIALMVWLLPVAEAARVSIIILTTYIIGLSHFPHIIAGSVEALYEVVTGEASWGQYLWGYMIPTLFGNIVGGVALISALNHAQVVAGRGKGI